MKRLLILLIILFSVRLNGQQQAKDNQSMEKAILQIIEKCQQYPLVALDEGHHNSRVFHEFLQTLVQSKKFPQTVQDIVVEFGNARYQHIMDDYINGKPIPDSMLRLCWRETTQVLVWDSPVYEQFFKTVRAVNKSLNKKRKIRILLADPPIDWSKVNTIEDWISFANRDEFAFNIIEKEVISKGRKALIIFGGLHLLRKPIHNMQALQSQQPKTLGERLTQQYPRSYWMAWTRLNTTNPVVTELLKSVPHYPTLLSSNLFNELSFDQICDFKLPSIESKPAHQENVNTIIDGILYLEELNALIESVPIHQEIFKETNYFNELVRRCKVLKHPALGELLKRQSW